jgi:hypothetical protein
LDPRSCSAYATVKPFDEVSLLSLMIFFINQEPD